MSNKHTPGQWQLLENESGELFERILAGNSQVAHVFPAYVKGVRNAAQTKANAHLIAAAPELLEACELISKYARRCDDIFDAEMSPKLVYEELEAAIAKAKGEPCKPSA